MYPAASINGSAAPGRQLPAGHRPDGASWPTSELPNAAWPTSGPRWPIFEVQAGNTAMAIFAVAVVMVFLVLAAQYESWSLPLAVILVVPMCLLSAIVGVSAVPMLCPSRCRGGPADINIFTQIGFVVLVGLASKNAILIVEFAKHQREAGMPRREATLAACQLRLRPIVMTSFAFILGVVPLLIAHGAGAEMRRTLGTAVFSGMLGVTLFGIFLTPVFFYVIDWLGEHAACSSSRGCASAVHPLRWTLGVVAMLGVAVRSPAMAPMRRRRAGRPHDRLSDTVIDRIRDRRAVDLAAHCRRSLNRRLEHLTKPETSASACSRASSSTGRSSPRCCRSSSRWAGGIAVCTLPVAQYPEITPPTVEVSAVYPGANAQVVADTVAAPIEQQVNGVEDMLYMSSQCTNDGTYTLTVTFKLGIDLNMAQVLVQNRVALAEPILPDLVKRTGVTVKKKSPNVLMIVNLFSPDEQPRQPLPEQLRHDPDPRRAGRACRASATSPTSASATTACGSGSIRRRWRCRGLTRQRRDHRHRSSRTSRSPPARSASRRSPSGQVFQYTMTTLGRLADAEQFANIILKTDASGRIVRLQRRGHDRAGRPGLRPDLHARRQALGGPVGLPAARLQRPEDGQAASGPRWRS